MSLIFARRAQATSVYSKSSRTKTVLLRETVKQDGQNIRERRLSGYQAWETRLVMRDDIDACSHSDRRSIKRRVEIREQYEEISEIKQS